MDLYRAYVNSMHNPQADQNSQQNQVIRHIVELRRLLDQRSDRNNYYFNLRQLSKCFTQIGMLGEAYKALSLLPPDQIGDLGGLLNSIENITPQQANMTIEIITKCNLRCPLCGGDDDKRDNYDNINRVMSLDNFKILWNKVRDYTGLAVLVGLGETFLHPQIYEIIEYIDKPIHIDTNGNIPLDHDRVARSNVSSLLFSIDGVDQRTYEKYRVGGNFNKAIENLEQMVAAKRRLGRGPVITFKYIVFKHNEMYVQQAAELASRIGVDRFQVNECNISPETGWDVASQFIPCGKNAISRVNFVDYKNKTIYPRPDMEQSHCMTVFQAPIVHLNGSLRPCCIASDDFIFGNLFEADFLEIWNSEPYKKFRRQALLNKFEFACCRGCLVPCNTFGNLFEGTELEYSKRGQPSDDCRYVKDIKIDAEYAKSLNEHELQYFLNADKLSPVAA